MTSALRTFELTKDYAVGFWRKRPHRALDRLTLDVAAGEVFGFLGPNGAGKTTTLKLLMQLVFPTSGRAEILGRPLGDVTAKRRIGYLPENPYFYDHLTAEELLVYFAALLAIPSADRRALAARLLDQVGIGAERRLQLRKFSKGMLQRVGIAQALLNDPELVILDEPMSGLDPLGRRDVRALILRLRDKGCTVFFSSHVLSDAEALCSRVAILAKGRLVAAGRLTEMVPFRRHRMGARDCARNRGDDRGSWLTRDARRAHRRRAIRAGTAARRGARTSPRSADERRRRARVVESHSPDARRLLRAAGHDAMRATAAIAVNVFRESVRDKVLYNLVVFAIILIAASYLLGQLTAGQDVKIIKDLGLSATAIFGLFIAIFIGIDLVSKEVERRSIYSLLSKPIHRYQLVLGKYAGLTLTLGVNVAVMAAALYAVLVYTSWGVPALVQSGWDAPALDPALLKAIALIFLELMVITAIATFFSSFSTPILSAAFTFGLFIVGHLSGDLRNFDQIVDSEAAARLARGLYWILPNLAQFDVKDRVVHGIAVPSGYMTLTFGYAVLYIAMLLSLSMYIFSRRDFK